MLNIRNEKGFTLIELLAVIVILAIILLIATPIVLNIINNSKESAALRSAELYIDGAQKFLASVQMKNDQDFDFEDKNKITITVDKLESKGYKVSGDRPNSGAILTITEKGITKLQNFKIKGYEIIISNGNLNVKKNNANIKKYSNGEVIYFNVDTGCVCTDDYKESQSNTGVKSGCMKFYAFNDMGEDTINLLLDHNTTNLIEWVSENDYVSSGGTKNDYGSNGKSDKGPITLLKQLKEDTKNWKGTIEPSDYTIDQTDQPNNIKFTINYSGYKARLITVNEIIKIIGNKTLNEVSAAEPFNLAGTGWLYDRTSTDCKNSGCLNNSDAAIWGYWTATSVAPYSDGAWYVQAYNAAAYTQVNAMWQVGVRPVITVSKNKL